MEKNLCIGLKKKKKKLNKNVGIQKFKHKKI